MVHAASGNARRRGNNAKGGKECAGHGAPARPLGPIRRDGRVAGGSQSGRRSSNEKDVCRRAMRGRSGVCTWGAPSECSYMAIRGEDERSECINVAKAGVISRAVTHTAAWLCAMMINHHSSAYHRVRHHLHSSVELSSRPSPAPPPPVPSPASPVSPKFEHHSVLHSMLRVPPLLFLACEASVCAQHCINSHCDSISDCGSGCNIAAPPALPAALWCVLCRQQ
jgi:hypothetical protein